MTGERLRDKDVIDIDVNIDNAAFRVEPSHVQRRGMAAARPYAQFVPVSPPGIEFRNIRRVLRTLYDGGRCTEDHN